MAYDFSKGSKTIRKVGFLDGVSGSKIRPTSPFSLESSKGLVAKYFDSTKDSLSSTRLLDQSPLNSGTRRTGEQGRCVDLNGINQAIRVEDNIAFDWNSELTCCFWAKNSSSSLSNVQTLLGKYDTGANQREFRLAIDTNNKLLFQYGNVNGTFRGALESDNAVSVQNFNFYSLTFSSGSVKLYLNGAEITASVTAGSEPPSSLPNLGADLIIGATLNSDAAVSLWDGQIFDVRIYKSVLTTGQITSIYADSPNNIQFDGQILTAHYKLDEQSGSTCYDSSGNGNNGTIENAVSNWGVTQDILSFQNQVGFNTSGSVYIPRDESDPTNDVLGNPLINTGRRPNDAALHSSNCLTLNGVNQYMSVYNTDVLNESNASYSYEGLFYFSSINVRMLLSKQSSTSSSGEGGGLIILSSGNLAAYHFDSAGNTARLDTTSSPVTTSIWYHIGVSYNFDTSTLSIYVNGELVKSGTAVGFTAGTSYNLTLGKYSNGNSFYFHGKMAGIKFYNSALSGDDFLFLANRRGSSPSAVVAGHYNLAEGSGVTTFDSSGNGNHGTIQNAATNWGVTQDLVHSNLIDGSGKRMWFDGVDDYVEINSVPSINFSDSFDIEIKVISEAVSNNDYILSHSNQSDNTPLFAWLSDSTIKSKLRFLWRNDANAVQFDLTTSSNVFDGNENTVRLVYNGVDKVEIFVNGILDVFDVSTPSGTFTATNWGVGVLNRSSISNYYIGVLSDLSISQNGTLISYYTGYGNTNADWIDQIGSNNGTVNGSPEAFYIPAAPDGLDVFGNELTEKPSNVARNRAETLIDLDPDSTPEMNNIYLESVFNGSTSNGYVTNDSVLNFTDNLTVSCWAKSDLTDITSSADTLVSMYEDTGNLEVWRMEISTDEKLRFQVGNSGGTGATIETADSAYPIDTWTHYAATFDGGVVKLYVNGELQSSSESSAHATSLNGRSAPLVLGAYYWSGGGGSFGEWDGALRNIRVYKGDSAPLSNSQIVRDMIETASQPRFEGQTVIASYDLIKDTLDRSGNGLNAQNNNISFTKKTVPASLDLGDDLGEDGIVQKTVKFDSGEWGAVFDGSSYAIVKNREKLKIKEKPFSIECSVKTSDSGSNTILSKYQTSGNLRSYSLNIESGKIVFHSSSNGTAVVSSTGSDTINDGSWHKIKVVRESESGTSLKMYVDDVEDTGVGGSLAANFSENISNVAIGAYNTDATAANVFTGNIRELKVFTDDNIERASWELSKDTRDNSSNNYHGENNGITFLSPKQEYGYSVSDSTPLGKQDQYLKEYHKSRLFL